ncbi:MAG TPA: integrase [Methanoculleus thermophilus]|nr:integrase [Bacillota bacterium]HQD25951.1 integrase [Methanoculleus thermophilus]
MTESVSEMGEGEAVDDFSRTSRTPYDGNNGGLTEASGFRTFNDLYETHRDGFIRWFDRRIEKGDLTSRTKDSYLSAVDRFLITEAEDDILEPSDFQDMGQDKHTRGVRNFLNYLEEKKVKNPLGYPLDEWRKNVKIRPSGIVEIYPSDREIIEAYNACPSEHKTMFKALVYSGSRFSQLYAALQNFNPAEVTIAGDTAHISSVALSSGTKRSFRMFFPAAFIPELERITLQSGDVIKKGIMHGRVSAKTIRKWNYNFMIIDHEVDTAAADFMQGRAPDSVGTANYLNKTKLAIKEYQKVVEHFPIPPEAGDTIPLPAGSQPPPKPTTKKPKPAPKKGGVPRKPIDYAKVKAMLKAGKLHREIIAETGINKTRLSEYVEKHPEFKRK